MWWKQEVSCCCLHLEIQLTGMYGIGYLNLTESMQKRMLSKVDFRDSQGQGISERNILLCGILFSEAKNSDKI